MELMLVYIKRHLPPGYVKGAEVNNAQPLPYTVSYQLGALWLPPFTLTEPPDEMFLDLA